MSKKYYVAFWNVENLFDVVNSPRRIEKLQRVLKGELDGWTESVLDRKIQQLASILMKMNQGKGPDIFGVCEVENKHVLERLKSALSSLNRSYTIAHHDMSDRRGIDVAFIYDATLFRTEDQFSHYIVKRSATRELFQVNFRTSAGKLLVLIGNHWPSRRGGQFESEPFRIIAGETLAYFHQRIRQLQGEDVAIIAMGDFNDEPFNRSVVNHALSERNRTKVTRSETPRFLNLMWPVLGEGTGTHYFSNIPNVLDQFLVSKGLIGRSSLLKVVQDSVEVVRFAEMVNQGTYPTPVPFGRKDKINLNGFSDHYPVAVQLTEE